MKICFNNDDDDGDLEDFLKEQAEELHDLQRKCDDLKSMVKLLIDRVFELEHKE